MLYANSRGNDDKAYNWLVLHSDKMQMEMGFHGILAQFRDPPFNYTNYPIILNMIPRLRKAFNERNYFDSAGDLAMMFNDALIRYAGTLIDCESEVRARMKNPFQWFFCGVEQIISIPLYFLAAFRILGSSTISRIQKSFLFKVGSAFIVLAGLVGSFISIINDGNTAYRKFLGLIGL